LAFGGGLEGTTFMLFVAFMDRDEWRIISAQIVSIDLPVQI
jgi:hypothetical protein